MCSSDLNDEAIRRIREEDRATKNNGGSWFNIPGPGGIVAGQNPDGRNIGDGTKQGGGWFHDSTEHALRRHNSKSTARKAASARIAKIPFRLARWIAHVYYPGYAQMQATP